MLVVMAVATTDGGTSLHNPRFVVGLTTALGFAVAAASDEQEVASSVKPIAATRYRTRKRFRMDRSLSTSMCPDSAATKADVPESIGGIS
jgi:hypothetical protein